jgi:hypothetical protein
MIAYLLLALAAPHQGGAPTNWQPLMGERGQIPLVPSSIEQLPCGVHKRG